MRIGTMRTATMGRLAALMALGLLAASSSASAQAILEATLAEPDQRTQEVSTAQLRQILAAGSAIVLDTRAQEEFEAGHIPGARNLGAPSAAAVGAVERLVNGNKAAALVLYCNGPYCQASRRLGEQLADAKFTNVRRYQLGIPIWRALGGPTEIELPGIVRIFGVDRTAVFIDVRSASEFATGTIPGARNLTIDNIEGTIRGMMSGQLQNAPLPLDDFNRRLVLVGRDGAQARAFADAMSRRPWHNVAYYPGSFDAIAAALAAK